MFDREDKKCADIEILKVKMCNGKMSDNLTL